MSPKFIKRLSILWICFQQILCSIVRFEITTDTVNFDTGGVTVTFTLFWNDILYSCDFTPSASSTTYVCASPFWTTGTITPQSGAPFGMGISYFASSNAFQIASINVVSDDIGEDVYYTIDEFCIAPGMQCTMDYVLTNGENSGSNCDQWDSKISYSAVAIGGLTQFEILYVAFRNAVEYYINSDFEGSVSPPFLTEIAFTTGNPGSGITGLNYTVNAIQWDQIYYQCDTLSGTNPDTKYSCTPNQLICPGTPSGFWFSLDADNDQGLNFVVTNFMVSDETGRTYYVDDFCVDDVDYAVADLSSNTDCSSLVTNGRETPEIQISRLAPYWRTVAGYFGSCIFEYPDDKAGSPIAATFDVTADRETSLPAGFGSLIPLDCIETSAPSDAPSNAPSNKPTQAPSESQLVWRNVLKINKNVNNYPGTSTNPYTYYTSGDASYPTFVSEIEPGYDLETSNFKSLLINEWENGQISVERVRLRFCRGGVEERYVEFDTSTTATWDTWFQMQYIHNTSWIDLNSSSPILDNACGMITIHWPDRFYLIYHVAAGCSSDEAWFMLSTASYCNGNWGEGNNVPGIIYIPGNTITTLQSTAIEGDAFIIAFLYNPPTPSPSNIPSNAPSVPSTAPSNTPSNTPSNSPSVNPINIPFNESTTTLPPSNAPSNTPTQPPSTGPTLTPTSILQTSTIVGTDVNYNVSTTVSHTDMSSYVKPMDNSDGSQSLIIGVSVGAVIVVIFLVIIIVILWFQKNKYKHAINETNYNNDITSKSIETHGDIDIVNDINNNITTTVGGDNRNHIDIDDHGDIDIVNDVNNNITTHNNGNHIDHDKEILFDINNMNDGTTKGNIAPIIPPIIKTNLADKGENDDEYSRDSLNQQTYNPITEGVNDANY